MIWAGLGSVSYDVLGRVRGGKICDRHRIWKSSLISLPQLWSLSAFVFAHELLEMCNGGVWVACEKFEVHINLSSWGVIVGAFPSILVGLGSFLWACLVWIICAQFWRHSELRTPKVLITLCRSLKRRDRTFFLVFPNVLTTYGGFLVPSWKAKMSYSYVVGKELLHLAWHVAGIFGLSWKWSEGAKVISI